MNFMRYGAVVVAFSGLAAQAHPIGRWMGDNLTNNNPPARNFEFAFEDRGIRNSVVRMDTSYLHPTTREPLTFVSSGVVIRAHRDVVNGVPQPTGMLCVLSADHSTAFPAGVNEGALNIRAIAFGNAAPGVRGILVGRRMAFRGPGNDRVRVDIAIFGVPIRDWDRQVPRVLTPPEIAEQDNDETIILAGFGRTARIDTAARELVILGGERDPQPGTYRAGTNEIDGVDANHLVAARPRLGTQTWQFDAIRSDMDFRGERGAEDGADAYILNADSGGPSFQLIGGSWRLIGSHSESQETRRGTVTEGLNQWDVRLWDQRAWIRDTCNGLVPEPSTFAALAVLFSGAALRRKRSKR